ncbi:MAG: type II CRISPR-associated endonuclease Cas1, partial [Paramuribaculum sp.]|nr:type II CRISPR-associated endonuclease Cas1 [Paramuribaculum sp.]
MVKRTLHFSNPAHLSLRHNQLVIRPQTEVGVREAEITRPIEDIGVLIIESQQVTLTSALLSHLLLNNVAVVTCDNLHMPAGMMLNLAGNTLMSERFDAQVSASAPLKKQLWQQTVSAKINNQAAALRIATDTETGCMRKWAG